MTRYVIVGGGAVGVTFAAEFSRAGRDVLLVARGAQLEALRAGRLRYVRPDGARLLDLPAAGGPDEVRLVDGDVLVLAVKTQDVESVVAEWAWREVHRPGRAPSSAAAAVPVVTLQNGLETDRIALRRFATVFAGVLGLPASYVEPGEVVSPAAPAVGAVWAGVYPAATRGSGPPAVRENHDRTAFGRAVTRGSGPPAVRENHDRTAFGRAGTGGPAPVASEPRLGELVEDLRAAGFEAAAVSDVTGFKTAKLLLSVTFALDALYPPSARRDEVAGAVVEEAREILTASGLPIGDLADEPTVDLSRFSIAPIVSHTWQGTSTWQSWTRGGSLETDFLNGEIVLAARLLGRSAPLNEALVERIHRAARDGTPPRSLGEDDVLATFPSVTQGVGGRPGGVGSTRSEVLVEATTLRRRLAEPNPPALLDVRWALGDPHGRDHHRAGHIPGAVYVDLDRELSGPPSPAAGRHPLPDVNALTEAARRWGLRSGRPVVVYDDSGGQAPARPGGVFVLGGGTHLRLHEGGRAARKRGR
ncbi:MAG: 2-dehydropantoate 2-reductase N-terminal domain-containing protein, partial [Frankia sp.]